MKSVVRAIDLPSNIKDSVLAMHIAGKSWEDIAEWHNIMVSVCKAVVRAAGVELDGIYSLPKEKDCSKCGLRKPIDAFPVRHRSKPHERFGFCNECRKGYGIDWCKKNAEQLKAQRAAYKKTEAGKAARRRDREKRKDWYREYQREYRKANRDKLMAQQKEYKQTNIERYRAYSRKYNKTHPDVARAYKARSRAAKLASGGGYTVAEWTALCAKYGNVCLCCGEQTNLAADHIIPVTLPYSTSHISNIQPLCKSCNSSKRNRTIDYRPDKSCLLRRTVRRNAV